MSTHRRFTCDSDTTAVRAAFAREGFVIFGGLELPYMDSLRRQLRDLIQLKMDTIDPRRVVSADTMLDRDLPVVHARNRGDFVHIYEAAHALPGLFGLCDDPQIRRIVERVGVEHPTMNLPPRLRMDFPQEDEFILPDHQDRHYNGGSDASITIWIPLVPITADIGPLGLRPGSHRLGSLPYRTLDRRPYLLLEPGTWQDDYPLIEPTLEVGEAVVFHMDLVHRSGRNRGSRPRVAVQLRFDDLADPAFRSRGWPTAYTVTVNQEQTVAV